MTITPEAEQCTGLSNLSRQLSCTISDTSIYVRLAPEDASQVSWAAGDTIQFQIGSITNPLSFGLSDSFQIYVATSVQQNYYVNQLVAGLSISNTEAGKMTNVQLLPDTN